MVNARIAVIAIERSNQMLGIAIPSRVTVEFAVAAVDASTGSANQSPSDCRNAVAKITASAAMEPVRKTQNSVQPHRKPDSGP